MGEAGSSVLGIGVVAVVSSLLLCWLLVSAAGRWRLTGKPALRRSSAKGSVAHLGSIGVAGACLIALAWNGAAGFLSQPAWSGWVRGSALILAMGLVDDLWWELPAWLKGLGQALAAALLIGGGISVQVAALPSWLNILVAVLWVIGLTNAINLLDILDGLAAAIAGAAAAAFIVLAGWAGQPALATLSAAIVGALLGFIVLNRPPARLYLGDAGSQWLGFTLAAIALAMHYAPLGREVALATPLIVLGLPVYDVAFVSWMRLRRGLSPFQKSDDHFVLRLRSNGASPGRSLLAMTGVAAAFALIGLFVSRAPNGPGMAAVALLIGVMIVWGRQLANVKMDA